MRPLLALERRMQDVERRLENMQRSGTISDVKFDEEQGRWYAKIEDGEDDERVVTDWLPWSSFAHGSIKFSVPPRKGQRAVMHSPNGDSEMAYAGPYHNSPEARSPHDKQDEVVMQIELPDGEDGDKAQNTLRVHATKSFTSISIGQTTFTIAGGQVTISTPIVSIDADLVEIDADVKIRGAILTHNDTNVGDTHKHTDVMPGGALTGRPV